MFRHNKEKRERVFPKQCDGFCMKHEVLKQKKCIKPSQIIKVIPQEEEEEVL